MQYALVDPTTQRVVEMFASRPGNPAYQSGVQRAADGGYDFVEPTSIESAPPGTLLRYDSGTGAVTAWPDPRVAIREKLESLSKKAQLEWLKSSGVSLTSDESKELDVMIVEATQKEVVP